MWHLTLHGRHGQSVRLQIPARPSWQSRLWTRLRLPLRLPISLLDRHYLIYSLPIPLTSLELDIWRPMTPDERQRWRNRPMDGEIQPMSDEERARRMGRGTGETN
jgi:hypothetical protein